MHSHSKHSKSNNLLIIIISVLLAVLVAISASLILIEHLKNKTNKITESSAYSDTNTSMQESSSKEAVESVESVESVFIPEASEIEETVSSKPKQTASNTASLKEKVEAVKPTDKNTIQVQTSINTSGLTKKKVQLAVKYLAQNPELPTGCEITSLTTVLNYYGFNVSKVTMAKDYLSKAEAPANFWKVFLGDPTKKTGFGCYAQPITDAANKYFKAQNANFVAKNISGTSFEKLLSMVENGSPIVIWGTMSMKKPYTTYKWTIGGETIQWIAPEHCLVLIGYDIDRGVAILSDPQKGIVSYKLDTVKARYIALYSQCVVLEELIPEESEDTDISSDDGNNSDSSSDDLNGDNSSDTTTTTPEGTEPPPSSEDGDDESSEDNSKNDDSSDTDSSEESSGSESTSTD